MRGRRKTMRVVMRDGVNVMSELTKVRNKSEVGALVEQEFHRAASERGNSSISPGSYGEAARA